MEFFDVVLKRRSIHYFTDEETSDDDINYILEAAKWTPSAGNCQPWRFVILRDPKKIHKVWKSTTGINIKTSKRSVPINPQNFIKKAPVIIVVCTDTTAYRGRQANIKFDLYSIQDSAAATMNLLLAACDRGLGACWVGMFREEALREALNLPPEMKPVAIIPVGHTRSKEKPQPRRFLEELIHHETYRNK